MSDESREITLLRRQLEDVIHTERYAAICAIDSFRKRAECAEDELAALRKQNTELRDEVSARVAGWYEMRERMRAAEAEPSELRGDL